MSRSGFDSKRTLPPYLASSLEQLPVELQRMAGPELPPDEPLETIFVVPRQMISKKLEGLGGMRTVPDQALIFTTQGVLHVLGSDKAGQAGQTTYLRGDRLLYTHLSLILLYDRVELCAAQDGELRRIVVEYNAVSHELFQPALHRFLRLSWQAAEQSNGGVKTSERFLYELRKASFKHRSGLEDYALQAGERLLGCVIQPPIMGRWLGVLRRKIAPPVLLALTDKQLIWIEEGMTSATALGWYITFCPRPRIAGFAIRPGVRWQEVSVQLSRGASAAERQTKLDPETALAWQELCLEQGFAVRVLESAGSD